MHHLLKICPVSVSFGNHPQDILAVMNFHGASSALFAIRRLLFSACQFSTSTFKFVFQLL